MAPAWGNWKASVTANGAFVTAITVAMVFLPLGNNLPKGCPPADLWKFRPAAIGIQAALRTVSGSSSATWPNGSSHRVPQGRHSPAEPHGRKDRGCARHIPRLSVGPRASPGTNTAPTRLPSRRELPLNEWARGSFSPGAGPAPSVASLTRAIPDPSLKLIF
ncbi:CbtA family protein [Streptomyces sp. NPDC055749]